MYTVLQNLNTSEMIWANSYVFQYAELGNEFQVSLLATDVDIFSQFCHTHEYNWCLQEKQDSLATLAFIWCSVLCRLPEIYTNTFKCEYRFVLKKIKSETFFRIIYAIHTALFNQLSLVYPSCIPSKRVTDFESQQFSQLCFCQLHRQW